MPLDPVLAGPLGEHRGGGSVGVRVSRVLTPRVTAELSVDYGFATLRITPANGEAIETTRASFIQAWRGVILFNRNRVLNSLTSTATLADGSARRLFTSGAVNINLTTSGALIPYVTVGAGVASMTGDLPSATLNGNYQFRLGSGPPVDETDTVTVHDARTRHALAGVLGGGVKYHVSSRWGLRFDARVALSKAAANTELNATPNVARLTPAWSRLPGWNAVDSIQQQLHRSGDHDGRDRGCCLVADRTTAERPSDVYGQRRNVRGERDYRGVLAVPLEVHLPGKQQQSR